MLNIIIGLALALVLSLGGNYVQHKNSVSDQKEISRLETANTGLALELNLAKSEVNKVDIAYGNTLDKIQDVDFSFGKIKDELKTINCVKPTKISTGNTNEEINPDAELVSKYYTELQAAYSLSNSN